MSQVARFLMIAWLALAAAPVCAQTVGFATRTLDGAPAPLTIAVWYPSSGASSSKTVGQVMQDLATDGPVSGRHLPLIVISHGTGGDDTAYADTAYDLARNGFVVVAPTHIGDNPSDHSRALDIEGRVAQIRRVIDFMISDWGAGAIDPDRVGAFGHSSGAMSVLIAAGGNPDLSLLGPHCAQGRAFFDCDLIRGGGRNPADFASAYPARFPHDPRLRAIVIAAPALGFTFTTQGLAAVRMPVQLWRAGDDELLPSPFYAEPVRDALPLAPDFHVAAHALHMDFTAPCRLQGDSRSQPSCASQEGFDRAAFHIAFNKTVAAFFKRALSTGGG